MKTTLGGERLGSGNKQEIGLRNYERSTHDLGYIWRSTMSSGTLVPFLNEVMLPGDTFEIDLDAMVLTHPTIGPLFGSYKVQLDVFEIPIRLYQAALQMNMANIGLEMEKIKLPLVHLVANNLGSESDLDQAQVNPSCLHAYLGTRGLGQPTIGFAERYINAIPTLGYWDIYKNYYANKQEEFGWVIHNNLQPISSTLALVEWTDSLGSASTITTIPMATNAIVDVSTEINSLRMYFATSLTDTFDIDKLTIEVTRTDGNYKLKATDIYANWEFDLISGIVTGTSLKRFFPLDLQIISVNGYTLDLSVIGETRPRLQDFPLSNIDDTRLEILQTPIASPYIIDVASLAPYGLPMTTAIDPLTGANVFSLVSNQEGLGIKTYQSDLNNNWLNSVWIDGIPFGYAGINMISSISTAAGFITINEINLKKKIYDMLNRVAVSDGSYDSWLDATYTHERIQQPNNPVYCGGLSKELIFQEVVSNAASKDEPLGTLAGRGQLSGKHKGGKIRVKADEPSYVMGIVSLTPRIDYTQGNKWSIDLKTMNDFHKPALDGIGFQNLVTDQIAYWETDVTNPMVPVYQSAGKVPAWINYMTNVNQAYGNFALRNQQMYMILARRYESYNIVGSFGIQDLTTYVDPSKFNQIFADTRLDAQNFWVQIRVDITARRKMSAKVIPNL